MTSAYAAAALARESDEVARTQRGRNHRLNAAAYSLGQLVGAGELDRGEVEAALFGAAERNGYVGKDGAHQAHMTIRSGLEKGIGDPRHRPEGAKARSHSPPARQSAFTLPAVVSAHPAPRLNNVPIPDWTEPVDGKPAFYAIGQDIPPAVSLELRRHVYRRDGQAVRVKVKRQPGSTPPWIVICAVRRPSDGATGWQPRQPATYVPCPYTGPEGASDPFADTHHGMPLWWMEGEKDVDTARALGLCAFTFGSASDVPEGFDALAGRDVIICDDGDDTGARASVRKEKAAAPIASSVHVVRFDASSPGWHDRGYDFTDFLEAGGDPLTLLPVRSVKSDVEAALPRERPTGDNVIDLKTKRKRKVRPPPSDTKPTLTLRSGEMTRCVDEAEAMLMTRGDLYQRGNQIVFMGDEPMKTHDARDIMASRIFPRSWHSLAEDLTQVCTVLKYDARSGDDVVADAPEILIKTLMARTGRYGFNVLTAIINAPTIRPDGSLLVQEGYDAATGLFYDPRGVKFQPINEKPTFAEAGEALAALQELIAGFPFDGEPSRAVALSGILTACVRQSLPTAPLHAYSAPAAGSGKGKLVDIASVISTGREAGVIPQHPDEIEMEKRIGGLLLEGAGTIAIDNCTAALDGNFLCALLTQTTTKIRVLGSSTMPKVQTNAFITATGNNITVSGDMTRRVVRARIDSGEERPELRVFDFDPVSRAKEMRGVYVSAVLTIILAYRHAGCPNPSNPLGSFEVWSSMIRDALIWLGCGDPCDTIESTRALDPKGKELSEVIVYWYQEFKSEPVTAKMALDRASTQFSGEYTKPDFHEALASVSGRNGNSAKSLGGWLSRNANTVRDGMRFIGEPNRMSTMEWRVERCGEIKD